MNIVIDKEFKALICEDYVRFKPKNDFWISYAEHNYLRINETMKKMFEREFVIEDYHT